MIELSTTTAIMLYLCMTLATLLSLWGYHHYQSRKKKVDLSHQRLIVCEYCHFAYLDRVTKPVTQCPQCESYNK
jgi:hypothetical protein